MAYQLIPVSSGKELKRFINFPYKLYRNEPHWIPPLRMEMKKQMVPQTNAMLGHCDVQHFLVQNSGAVLGRVSAFVNHLAVEEWQRPVGMFGSFESIQDQQAAQMLLQGAADWLKSRGMDAMQGPWSFASQECGLLAHGFHLPPMIMAPYNPPWYLDLLESFGLKKAKDLMVYGIQPDGGYEMPQRFVRMAEAVEKRHQITVRPIRMSHLKEDVRILLDVANRSTQGNWGFIPVTDAEADELADSLKPVIDPDIVLIAENSHEPVGYFIALPNINELLAGLNGRLFPRGMYRLLLKQKSIQSYRVWALGVIPQYQRKAIDTMIYQKFYQAVKEKNARLIEANYVLEDNMVMNNPILKMGFKHTKTYRVYEMPLK